MFVVFLSNRVHPDGKGDVTPLRAQGRDRRASALVGPCPPTPARGPRPASRPSALRSARRRRRPRRRAPVLTGIDVLRAEGFAPLAGQARRAGHQPHRPRARRRGDDRSAADGQDVTLVALFSPEHGIRGMLDDEVPSSKDEKTGLPIHSLYGETRRPTAAMLAGIDTMVDRSAGHRRALLHLHDDDGATCMEEAAKRKIEVVVLDRPNPINGWQIEGPALDETALSFIGYLPHADAPRHDDGRAGAAVQRREEDRRRPDRGRDAELAARRLVRRDRPAVDQPVAEHAQPEPGDALPGHRRDRVTNISVGRGTDTPFEQIGAPWIDGVAAGRRR